MRVNKQFIVIKICPEALPETKFMTLPYIEFSNGEEAIQWIQSELSDVLPDDAVLDEKNLILGRSCDDDSSDDEEELDDYDEFEGYYFIFNSDNTHYHILIKDVLL